MSSLPNIDLSNFDYYSKITEPGGGQAVPTRAKPCLVDNIQAVEDLDINKVRFFFCTYAHINLTKANLCC